MHAFNFASRVITYGCFRLRNKVPETNEVQRALGWTREVKVRRRGTEGGNEQEIGELGVIEEDKIWAFFPKEETRNEDLAGKEKN